MKRMLELDLRSLAAFRIALGSLLFYDLFWRMSDVTFFYSDHGTLPRSLVTKHYWNDVWWCLHLYSGTTIGVGVLFFLHAVAALCLMTGFHTRWAGLACYLATLSLHNRNPLVLDSSDRLLVILLFWGLFIPWGARWSLDSRRKTSGYYPSSTRFYSVGTTGYLLQVVQLYLVAGYWKLHPVWLTEMSGLYRTLMIGEFSSRTGLFLLQYPGLMQALTVSTVIIEILAPLLLLTGKDSLRLLALAALTSLHLGIYLTMDLEFFPLVSLVTLVGLLPSKFWEILGMRTESADSRGESCPGVRWCHGRTTTVLAVTATVATMAWNLMVISLDQQNVRAMPKQLLPFTQTMGALRLVQMWNLFSPVPRSGTSWYVVEAYLADGSRVDLWREGNPVDFAPRAVLSEEYPSHRHRTFLYHLAYNGHQSLRQQYLRVLAESWNSSHSEQKKVQWVRLVTIDRPTELDYRDSVPRVRQTGILWFQEADWTGPPPPLPGLNEGFHNVDLL